jgi:hypothetical protein
MIEALNDLKLRLLSRVDRRALLVGIRMLIALSFPYIAKSL